MKHTSKLILAFVISAPLLFSCGKKADGGQTKNEEVKSMGIQEAVDFVKADEANSGKEITVKGYCWNVTTTDDGVTHVDLGDVKLEGMQQAPLSANFASDKKTSLSEVKKDKTVTIKGKIMKTPYVYYMDGCELIKVE